MSNIEIDKETVLKLNDDTKARKKEYDELLERLNQGLDSNDTKTVNECLGKILNLYKQDVACVNTLMKMLSNK